jgi:hypothetical protein
MFWQLVQEIITIQLGIINSLPLGSSHAHNHPSSRTRSGWAMAKDVAIKASDGEKFGFIIFLPPTTTPLYLRFRWSLEVSRFLSTAEYCLTTRSGTTVGRCCSAGPRTGYKKTTNCHRGESTAE